MKKTKYADVYLLPIPKKNLTTYRSMAKKAGKVFRKHGAISYREYVFSDKSKVEQWGLVPFSKNMKLKNGEVVVYASVEFNSEAHRNKVMKKVMADKSMENMATQKPIFDMKRMVYGGYKVIVDA